MTDVKVLTEAEAHRINYAAAKLGISRDALAIKVCQFKSLVQDNATKAAALKAELLSSARTGFSDVSGFMKLVYGIAGLVSIAFAIEVATGVTAILLFALGAFLLYVGLEELRSRVVPFWEGLKSDFDRISII
jgi:hypothetical protein